MLKQPSLSGHDIFRIYKRKNQVGYSFTFDGLPSVDISNYRVRGHIETAAVSAAPSLWLRFNADSTAGSHIYTISGVVNNAAVISEAAASALYCSYALANAICSLCF